MSHFHAFGASHWWALAAIAVGSALPVIACRLLRNDAFDAALRWILAALLLVDWIAYLAMFYLHGWLALGNVLPLNLCDWATIALAVALIRPNQMAYDLAYFWALSGTLLTSLTPDLEFDFPDPRFIFFFLYHAIIITGVLTLTVGLGMRPVAGSMRRVILWSLFYVAVAGTADALLGTNYGFLRAKPAAATLFDALAPWPWYIGECFAIGVAAMLILYAPFFVAGRMRRSRTA
ncbi:MAG: TIGR02206 family membrane protein [Rhizomicrobium sp.]